MRNVRDSRWFFIRCLRRRHPQDPLCKPIRPLWARMPLPTREGWQKFRALALDNTGMTISTKMEAGRWSFHPGRADSFSFLFLVKPACPQIVTLYLSIFSNQLPTRLAQPSNCVPLPPRDSNFSREDLQTRLSAPPPSQIPRGQVGRGWNHVQETAWTVIIDIYRCQGTHKKPPKEISAHTHREEEKYSVFRHI